MKKKLLLILVLFIHLSMFASKGVDIIWNNDNKLKITRFILSDVSTDVTFSYTGSPNSWIQFSSSIYASDEAGIRHRVIGTEGIELDNQIWLGDDGYKSFTLHFDPLPKDTRVFDIIESEEPYAFKIYGIHSSKTKLKLPAIREEISKSETSDAWFKSDSTIVRLNISSYDREVMPYMMRVEYTGEHEQQNPIRREKLGKIDTNGAAKCTFLMDHPKWTRITLDLQRAIPFYARPGDTVDIHIDNYGAWNERITYKEHSSRPVYSQLQNIIHNPLSPEFIFATDTWSCSRFSEWMRDMENSYARLYQYFAWKYHLTPWENHLLVSDFHLKCFASTNRFINGKIMKSDHAQSLSETNELKSAMKEELRNMGIKAPDWSDRSLLYCPNWSSSLPPEETEVRQIQDSLIKLAAKSDTYEQYPKYRMNNPKGRAFIDSLASRSESKYIELLFVNSRTSPGWTKKQISRFIDIAADLEGKAMHFILIASKGYDKNNLTRLQLQLASECKLYCSEIDVVYLREEEIIDLQEVFNIYVLPDNVTLTRDGKVFYKPLRTNGDMSRTLIRQMLRDETNNT